MTGTILTSQLGTVSSILNSATLQTGISPFASATGAASFATPYVNEGVAGSSYELVSPRSFLDSYRPVDFARQRNTAWLASGNGSSGADGTSGGSPVPPPAGGNGDDPKVTSRSWSQQHSEEQQLQSLRSEWITQYDKVVAPHAELIGRVHKLVRARREEKAWISPTNEKEVFNQATGFLYEQFCLKNDQDNFNKHTKEKLTEDISEMKRLYGDPGWASRIEKLKEWVTTVEAIQGKEMLQNLEVIGKLLSDPRNMTPENVAQHEFVVRNLPHQWMDFNDAEKVKTFRNAVESDHAFSSITLFVRSRALTNQKCTLDSDKDFNAVQTATKFLSPLQRYIALAYVGVVLGLEPAREGKEARGTLTKDGFFMKGEDGKITVIWKINDWKVSAEWFGRSMGAFNLRGLCDTYDGEEFLKYPIQDGKQGMGICETGLEGPKYGMIVDAWLTQIGALKYNPGDVVSTAKKIISTEPVLKQSPDVPIVQSVNELRWLSLENRGPLSALEKNYYGRLPWVIKGVTVDGIGEVYVVVRVVSSGQREKGVNGGYYLKQPKLEVQIHRREPGTYGTTELKRETFSKGPMFIPLGDSKVKVKFNHMYGGDEVVLDPDFVKGINISSIKSGSIKVEFSVPTGVSGQGMQAKTTTRTITVEYTSPSRGEGEGDKK